MGQSNQISKLESQGTKQGSSADSEKKDQDMNQKKQAEERASKLAEEQKNKNSPKRESNSSDSGQV